MEALPHALVAGRVRVEAIGKVADVIGAEEIRAPEQMEVVVAGRLARPTMSASSSRTRRRVNAPSARAAGRSMTEHCPCSSTPVGPGWSSATGQVIGVTTMMGTSG